MFTIHHPYFIKVFPIPMGRDLIVFLLFIIIIIFLFFLPALWHYSVLQSSWNFAYLLVYTWNRKCPPLSRGTQVVTKWRPFWFSIELLWGKSWVSISSETIRYTEIIMHWKNSVSGGDPTSQKLFLMVYFQLSWLPFWMCNNYKKNHIKSKLQSIGLRLGTIIVHDMPNKMMYIWRCYGNVIWRSP